jgi:hypothetical protein
MKLAEALALRSDLQKKLASLRSRVGNNAVVQEGTKPHEDPAALMKEAFGVISQLTRLVGQINAANSRIKLPDGRTLTMAVADRDELTQKHSLIQHAIDNSSKQPDRYSMAEIRWIAAVDVAKLQKQLEDLSKKIRELNLTIQEVNWNHQLE